MPVITIRRSRHSDADAVMAVFRDAILNGARNHYSDAQRTALGRSQTQLGKLAEPR